jgi:hypothetical protein
VGVEISHTEPLREGNILLAPPLITMGSLACMTSWACNPVNRKNEKKRIVAIFIKALFIQI